MRVINLLHLLGEVRLAHYDHLNCHTKGGLIPHIDYQNCHTKGLVNHDDTKTIVPKESIHHDDHPNHHTKGVN